MKMQIGRWGNSLAVRLPRGLVDRFGLKEGGELDISGIEAELEKARAADQQSQRLAAIEEMKQARWELPTDWKFDREEANWRPALDRC